MESRKTHQRLDGRRWPVSRLASLCSLITDLGFKKYPEEKLIMKNRKVHECHCLKKYLGLLCVVKDMGNSFQENTLTFFTLDIKLVTSKVSVNLLTPKYENSHTKRDK